MKGVSPADQSQKYLDDFMIKLSEPLKKMQITYLTNATKNCYKEQHLSDSFPNYEQILLCKELERQKVFRKFEGMLASHRDTTQYRYLDCVNEANNDAEKAVYCIREYLKKVQDDNAAMTIIFKKEFASYL